MNRRKDDPPALVNDTTVRPLRVVVIVAVAAAYMFAVKSEPAPVLHWFNVSTSTEREGTVMNNFTNEEQITFSGNLRRAQEALNDAAINNLAQDGNHLEILQRFADCTKALAEAARSVSGAAMRQAVTDARAKQRAADLNATGAK